MERKIPRILALDLEGTLISNAMSQIPRPGLFDFLTRCYDLFPRIVAFTTVKEELFRKIAHLLVDEKCAPAWFAEIEYVNWFGDTKNLEFIHDAHLSDVLLVDDFEKYVHPGQESQWVPIDHFDYPYESTDIGLAKILIVLEKYAQNQA